MSDINHQWLDKYFNDRPQIERPQATVLGFEIPFSWKCIVEKLLSERDELEQAQIRIDALEDRLELYPVNFDGTRCADLKLEIGSNDGIGCREDTIALLDENNSQLRSIIKAIRFQAHNWYQDKSSDGPAFTMKGILEKCDEALGKKEKGER